MFSPEPNCDILGQIRRERGTARGIYAGDGVDRSQTRHESFVEALKHTYGCLKAFQSKNGYTPSRVELAKEAGTSTSNLERHLQILMSEGFVARITEGFHMARNLKVTDRSIDELKVSDDEVFHVKQVRGKLVLHRVARKSLDNRKLPRMTKADQDARIEMVVAKARAKTECRIQSADDVIHVDGFQRFTACKVG